MKENECDTLVVGAGPAGSSASIAASREGMKVVLIDRKLIIGVPIRCAEYIPALLLREENIGRESIVQSVKGMRTMLPDGKIKETSAPGFIIRRDVFDQILVKEAIKAGAEMWPGSRALTLEKKAVLVRRDNEIYKIKAEIIIGADGPHSKVGKWIESFNKNLIPALQAKVSLVDPMDYTEVFFDKEYFAGYSWLFPRGDIANVGLGMKNNAGNGVTLREGLIKFLSRLKNENKIKGDILDYTAGWIPAERPRSIVRDNILLVGDAAGHTHPISGAGISRAVICGFMAGKWAARALERRDISLLKEYEREWYDFYGECQERACERCELMEREWDNLDEIIKKCWIGFKEYYLD
jgi:digeranylgeranylglycerophospholipid reductase